MKYSCISSIEPIKKHGLRYPVVSNSAKHARVLTGQLSAYLQSMHGIYTDTIGFRYLNIFYAPFLQGLSKEYLKQEAQSLLFSCTLNSMPCVELHIYTDVPRSLENIPAVVSGGNYILKKPNNDIIFMKDLDKIYLNSDGTVNQPEENTIGRILTYDDFRHEATEFCKSLVESWTKGDGDSKPFHNMMLYLHVHAGSFVDSVQADIIKTACKNPANIMFVLDRHSGTSSTGASAKYPSDDTIVDQSIALNIAQCAYKGKNLAGTISESIKVLDIAVKAFMQHKTFVQKLAFKNMDYGENDTSIGHEHQLSIGLVGLEQAVHHIEGKPIQEPDALKTALKITAAVYTKCREYEKSDDIKIMLGVTPDASDRMVHIDSTNPDGLHYEIYSDSLTLIPGMSAEENIEFLGRFNPIYAFPIRIVLKSDKAFDLLRYAYSGTEATLLEFIDH